MTLTIRNNGDKTTTQAIHDAGIDLEAIGGASWGVVPGSSIGHTRDLLVRVDGDEATVYGEATLGIGFADHLQGMRKAATTARAEDFHAFMDSEIDRAEGNVGPLMRERGYEPHTTGGGLMAWRRPLDEATEDYLLVTNEAQELSGEPESLDWVVGRYRGEGWISVGEFDLTQALALADLIPAPTPTDETHLSGAEALARLTAERSVAPTP